MKRLLILLTLLLLAALPSLAEMPPEEAVAALHPGLAVTDHIMAGEDAFFLLQSPEGVRSLCVLRRENGAWAELLHSEKVICPADRSDRHDRYAWNGVSIAWDGATLSLCYECVTGTAWQYDFARDEAGEWRFVRLCTTAATYPAMIDVQTWDGYCVYDTFIRRWNDGREEASRYVCPMPWLAGCETLAGFDAAAFPMDVTSLNDDDMARVAAVLLPEYTFVSGCYGDGAAFIMENAAGERVFMGGEYRDGAWLWTESQPLPADASCDDYHGSGDSLILWFSHPDGLMCDWDETEPLWIRVVAYREADEGSPTGSRWMVRSILNDNEDGFHMDEVPGFYINHTGVVYGTVTFERDMRYIDWSTFPLSLEEALMYLAEDMGVIGVRCLTLYADAACTQVIAEYRYATPVTVLGREGNLAQVRIADSDVTGWIDADALLLGAAQLIPDVEDPGWIITAEYYSDWFSVPAGTAYYDAPEGSLLGTVECDCEYTLLAVYGDWYHVCFGESLESVWVRTADGTIDETMP